MAIELHSGNEVIPGSTLVSVCIPTRNRGALVEEAVASALAQTYEPLEVVVVDDGSTDGTPKRLFAVADDRLRVVVNPRPLGQNGNRNRSLTLARGALLKLLDDDDWLREDCVAKMVDVAARDRAIGLVFCRREIFGTEYDTSRPGGFAEVHTNFASIDEVNDGRRMLAELMAVRLGENWIGEPTTVLIRRSHLEHVGGFSRRVRQSIDVDLWTRLMTCSLVGFVDEKLARYRIGHERESEVHARERVHWLDRLWMLETLAADTALEETYPQLREWRQAERRQAWRTSLRLGRPPGGGRLPLRPYFEYLGYRARAAAGRRPAIVQPLMPVAAR
jgi:glycosyltransferase involved in cell wall biosynthesis